MGPACDVCARGREYRIPVGWPGDGFCPAGGESQRRGLHSEKQGQGGRRRFSRYRAEGPRRGSGYRCFDACGTADVFALPRVVCRRLSGRLNVAGRWRRQREDLWEESYGPADRPPAYGQHSGVWTTDDFNLAEGLAEQQVRSEVVAEQRRGTQEEIAK